MRKEKCIKKQANESRSPVLKAAFDVDIFCKAIISIALSWFSFYYVFVEGSYVAKPRLSWSIMLFSN